MNGDILYIYNGEWTCDCAHASVHHPQKGWCCDAYYRKYYEPVSCREAYGTELCKKSAYKHDAIHIDNPKMLFPEGEIENTNLCISYYVDVLGRLCEKFGYKMVKK